MAKYKFRLVENKSGVLKPSEIDPTFLKSIESLYGKVNMEEDFFSSDLEKYYKVDEIDKETGSVSHTLIKLASFDDLIKHLSQANESSQILQKSPSLNKDKELQIILGDINKVFNKFRTHLRKNYPDQYKNITKFSLDEESATGATGDGPLTPFAFKPIKKNLNEAPLNNFQNQRIKAFDDISKEMNNIYTMLSNAKNKTSAFYNSNPENNKIIYPTELVHDYFEDIKLILKQEQQ